MLGRLYPVIIKARYLTSFYYCSFIILMTDLQEYEEEINYQLDIAKKQMATFQLAQNSQQAKKVGESLTAI